MLEPFQNSLHQNIQAAGLVDLDGTFLVQLGIFLVFFLVLRALVVKPMVKAQEARYSRMEGARQQAESMDLRAAEAFTSYDKRMDEARKSAVTIREDLKREAAAERNRLTADVTAEVNQQLAAGQQRLDAQVAEVRAAMQREVEALATLAADRILRAEEGNA